MKSLSIVLPTDTPDWVIKLYYDANFSITFDISKSWKDYNLTQQEIQDFISNTSNTILH